MKLKALETKAPSLQEYLMRTILWNILLWEGGNASEFFQ